MSDRATLPYLKRGDTQKKGKLGTRSAPESTSNHTQKRTQKDPDKGAPWREGQQVICGGPRFRGVAKSRTTGLILAHHEIYQAEADEAAALAYTRDVHKNNPDAECSVTREW